MVQKRKVLSLGLCLMVVGLIASLISGCAGGGNGGDGDDVEIPQYGGVLVTVANEDPVGFDDAIVPHYQTTGPYQCLWGGDWAKGNAGGYGTGECDWFSRQINRLEYKTGKIAESWEIGDDYIVFHLREGVRWQDKFPTNGRGVTADDVVFSFERQKTLDTAYVKLRSPALAAAMSASKVDDRTVRIDCTSEQMPELISLIDFIYIYPKDVIETYGDMNAWDRAIGTSAFSLEEYMPGSYLYYERNPDYWGTNPVGPGAGDQLPYLDGVKTLIESGPSTIDSLFSTGQITVVTADTADYDRVQTLKELSGVEYVRFFNPGVNFVICMRTDKEGKPYKDVKVRQALMLAIDHQKIVDELYGGEGEILYWPVYYCKEYAGAYLALKDYPAEVQDLFGYNPTKAKQLLADAAYADGFQAEIVVYDLYPYTDAITMVKDMWAEIGVDLTIKPVDYDTFLTILYMRGYDDMLCGAAFGPGSYFKGTLWSDTDVFNNMYNASYVDDPVLNDYREQMLAAYPDEDECDRIHCEMLPYLLEQCYVLQTAGYYTYRFWWPWVKNYSGEGSLDYYGGITTWTPYVWIDQELKQEMGHGD
jgi:peptide/nickel transport system substrate-binding protein